MSEGSERDSVLGAIRTALGVKGTEKSREATVQRRLERHPSGLVPDRARRDREGLIALFTEMLEGQNATVTRIAGIEAIPETIAAYLREHNLPAELRTGTDPLLADAPWNKASTLKRLQGRAEGGDAVTVSRAAAAAAETGTLFLTSGPENPTTLNFLPETHIAVIRADDILGAYEDAWNRLREVYGERALPRTVNLVSGPSRTADIEQIIVMGAHGPKRLHVIVVG